MAQAKKGYIYGVLGMLITQLNADGTTPAVPTKIWVNTPTKVGFSASVEEGESATHRGGDRVLCKIEEPDVVIGMDLDFTDARFNFEAQQLMLGGSLITDGGDTVGWTPPTVAEQQTSSPRFKVELYAQNYDATGTLDGYIKHTLGFCKASMGDFEHADQSFATPGVVIKGRENPSVVGPAWVPQFVSTLPPEATG